MKFEELGLQSWDCFVFVFYLVEKSDFENVGVKFILDFPLVFFLGSRKPCGRVLLGAFFGKLVFLWPETGFCYLLSLKFWYRHLVSTINLNFVPCLVDLRACR